MAEALPEAAPMRPGTETSKDRGQWSSEPAFVFSMAAAAVGLGNLWRFPYLAGEYGGGGFILAYLVAMVIVCLPLMYLEVAAGRLAQGNTVHTFRQVHRTGAWYGWFVVGLTTVITSYYLVITGWTMGYAVDAVRQDVRPFAEFSDGYASLAWVLVVLAVGAILLVRGLQALETFSKFMMPVLLLVVVGLVATANRTAGWGQAKDFLLTTDLSALRDPSLWVIAFGQGFYSLAIGQGYLVTYGSYIPRKTHVPRASLIIAGTETCIALLAGWMIFPFVFTHELDPGEGSQLAFNTLPRAFEAMAWGAPVAIAFFGFVLRRGLQLEPGRAEGDPERGRRGVPTPPRDGRPAGDRPDAGAGDAVGPQLHAPGAQRRGHAVPRLARPERGRPGHLVLRHLRGRLLLLVGAAESAAAGPGHPLDVVGPADLRHRPLAPGRRSRLARHHARLVTTLAARRNRAWGRHPRFLPRSCRFRRARSWTG